MDHSIQGGRAMMRKIAVVAAVLALAACGPSSGRSVQPPPDPRQEEMAELLQDRYSRCRERPDTTREGCLWEHRRAAAELGIGVPTEPESKRDRDEAALERERARDEAACRFSRSKPRWCR
jgi:hypothetical protein